MNPNPQPTLQELTDTVRLLTERAVHSERRLQSLERVLRWLTLLVVAGLGLGVVLGTNLTGNAWAESGTPSLVQEVESTVKDDVAALKREEARETGKAEAAERTAATDFEDYMDRVRADVAHADKFDPGRTIAVVLHDMKRMLEAVPVMAADVHQMNLKMGAMPSMAVDMHEMNYKMGIMSYGVDSTMGRMGRAMPWAPW